MSVTYGFYNSENGDRTYDAIQMSSIFDGIIKDGVFSSIGGKMFVKATAGMTVNVESGRAWFDHTWTYNDAVLPIVISDAHLTLNRIDTVVLDIDSRQSVRANTIKVVTGTPAGTPSAPTLIKSADHNQYPLCNISVKKGVTAITQANITNRVGSNDCPFITGILETVSTTELVRQWEDEWTTFVENQSINFMTWINLIQATIDENIAATLTNRLLKIEEVGVSRPEMHRVFFRGKNLGTIVTPYQQQAIWDGSFNDLYLGDYWVINGLKWRIVDINYWLNAGTTSSSSVLTHNHLVIMPDEDVTFDFMNIQNIVTGGYKASYMFTTGLINVRQIVSNAFPDLILSHLDSISNSVASDNSYANGFEYVSMDIDIPTEFMIFGTTSSTVNGKYYTGLSKFQFSLFTVAPQFRIANHENQSFTEDNDYWLRDIHYNKFVVCRSGWPTTYNPGVPAGIRPVFAIGATSAPWF